MKACSVCSTTLLPFSRFCHQCGAPIESTPPKEEVLDEIISESINEEQEEVIEKELEKVKEEEAITDLSEEKITEELPDAENLEINLPEGENELPPENVDDPTEIIPTKVVVEKNLADSSPKTEEPSLIIEKEETLKDISTEKDQLEPAIVDTEIDLQKANLSYQLEQAFLDYFARFLDDLNQSERLPDYLSNLKKSGFYSVLEPVLESQQALLKADHFHEVPAIGSPMYIKLSRKWISLVEKLMIDFIASYNAYELPASILFYQEANAHEVNLPQMIRDYLGLHQENEVIYTDFAGLESDKKAKAKKRFLKAGENEAVHLICDQSMFGNMKEGFAFTSRAFYWKPHFHKAYQFPFRDIKTVELGDWLMLNKHYFHSSKRMNIKMALLMKKLQVLFAA